MNNDNKFIDTVDPWDPVLIDHYVRVLIDNI